ncbi:FAD-dependent oxidoreductase (plasmid) [Sphingobium sp. SJ10-10]|uniref:NAD(P)/FAD-dependent oxidoreductase n=1 Tax=Sphingobium sp. SJ10-10 TaxID=3114999 RepID=UPI002E19DA8E|nr:FAD-dependent oxidoreductase [Sphingobium sp. SJ10-10]
MHSVVVIGANLAGGRAVESLRNAGFEGRITLVGEEPWLPYERPPLSKDVLWDSASAADNLFLHDERWYADNRIDVRLGVRAQSIDLTARGICLAGGELIQADCILLATGGAPRKLNIEGADAKNLHYLRTKDDATRIAASLSAGARIVIVGMGIIGAEVAASAVKLGCEVIAIEPLAAPMVRALGPQFGRWLGAEHRKNGVDTRFGRGVTSMKVCNGRISQIELDNGSLVACDTVVVGVGIVPNIELAKGAGIATANGIIVDRECRTSHSYIFAAGDVAEQESFFGGRIRQETYQNASEQAHAAVMAMLGQKVDYCRPAWFWSDQFDLNIQFCGHVPVNGDVVVRGDVEEKSFTAFFRSGPAIEGVLTVNRAQDMGIGRRLVERRLYAAAEHLSDRDLALRELLND